VISFFFLSALWRGDAARFLTSMDLDLDLDWLDLLVVVICLRTAGTAEATILLIGACAGACDSTCTISPDATRLSRVEAGWCDTKGCIL
jgi:hypothetical protein